jgi:dTDP-glucose 4,6-dehydratase
MKILMTGGTGFFGRTILKFFNENRLHQTHFTNTEFIVMSRNPEAFLQKNPEFASYSWLSFHQGDILDPSSFPKVNDITAVVHAAADSLYLPGFTPLNQLDQIVSGTRNTLDFALKVGAKRFLFTSSGAVYGPQPQNIHKLPENYVGNLDSLKISHTYGIAKRQAELLCTLYSSQYGLHTNIARCFAFVGPDLALGEHFAIGNFIKNALQGEDIIVQGDGTPLRSYLYQDDLAHYLLKILFHAEGGSVFNVGSDEAISIKELAELVRTILSPSSAVIVKGQDLSGDRSRYVPDIEKIKSQLGLRVNYPLSQAIELTATAIQKQKKFNAN